jgi:phenylacetate-CoA ligase
MEELRLQPNFFQPQLEKLSRSELEALQNKKLMEAFKRANNIPFLRPRLSHLQNFRGIQDLQKLPFTTKKDLADCFPFGALAVSRQEVARVHTSSGSTSKPIATFYTKNDLVAWSELLARGLACIGAAEGDIFQNTVSLGMFTGGLGYIDGAARLGLTVVPLGSANAERQLETMHDFEVTVFHAIPSFGIRMAELMESLGGSFRESLKIKLAMFGAEPWTMEMRTKIEDCLGIHAFNNYGLAEVGGPGVAVECPLKAGLHVWEDYFIAEVIDPKTCEPLEDEEEGELVITPLSREAMPLIRYRTGDITRIIDGKCGCGRSHKKIDWLKGRLDDMIKVRGIGIYPSNIEKIIARHKESNGHFQILLSGIDDITVKFEVKASVQKDQQCVESLRSSIFQEIKDATMLRTNVEIVERGSLPRTDGKAKRVVDTRRFM